MYKWICPVCGAHGKKWLPRHKTGKCGRMHLRKTHNIYERDVDFLTKRVDIIE